MNVVTREKRRSDPRELERERKERARDSKASLERLLPRWVLTGKGFKQWLLDRTVARL
jgi:hypothetical protein